MCVCYGFIVYISWATPHLSISSSVIVLSLICLFTFFFLYINFPLTFSCFIIILLSTFTCFTSIFFSSLISDFCGFACDLFQERHQFMKHFYYFMCKSASVKFFSITNNDNHEDVLFVIMATYCFWLLIILAHPVLSRVVLPLPSTGQQGDIANHLAYCGSTFLA